MSVHLQRALLVLALVAAGFLVVRSTRKARGPIERNRIFAADVWNGQFPYDPHPELGYDRPVHAPYPPSYGVVMGWQLLLPTTVVRVLWSLLQIALLFVLFRHLTLWWRTTIGARGPPVWVVLATLLLVSRYLLRDTAGGGANLVFGTLVCLACLRPGEARGVDRHPWRGLLLGLVLAAKPTPLFFLPWLVLRGRYRTLGVALLSAALLHASPLLLLGVDGWREAYGRWLEGAWLFATQTDSFAPAAHGFPGFEHNQWMHQSLRFMAARFLGTVPTYAEIDSSLFFQGAGFAPTFVALVQRALSAALALLVFALLWARRREESGWSEGLGFGALVCLTNLISPIVWKSYWVQAIPVFFVLLASVAVCRRQSPRLGVLLLLYFVVCVALAGDVVGKHGKELLQSLYVVPAFGLALLLACAQLLWRAPRLVGEVDSAPPE